MNALGSLSSRDRATLLAGAVVIVAALFYLAVWEPLDERRTTLIERTAQQTEQLAAMRRSAAEARQLRGRGTTATTQAAGGSLLSNVDQAASATGLKPSVKRVAPEGDSTVRVWLGEAPYGAVVKWLEALAKQGITPRTVQMEHGEGGGRVDARVLLAGPA